MKRRRLFIVIFLLLIISNGKAFAQLQWPLDTFTIRGTFGDYRPGGFHGGIDLHNTTGDTPFRPVRSGTTFYLKGGLLICYFSDGDCDVYTKYQNIEYVYSHVDDQLYDPGPPPMNWIEIEDGAPIDNFLYNGYLGKTYNYVSRFGPGNEFRNHLHLGVIDQFGNKRDPLYKDNSTDFRLDLTQYNDTKTPTLVELVVAEYFGPNIITVLNANHLPFNRSVDFIVYIHDTPSPAVSWDEKVGVNWIEWQVTTTTDPPSTWNQFVKFTDYLPTSTAEAEAIYALSGATSPLGRPINTFQSGEGPDHIDTMWYIVTNSDGTTAYIYNQSYAWMTPGVLSDRYVWIRARDSNGYTVMGNVQIHIDGGAVIKDGLPKAYALMQNYPNPFNPETSIPYELPAQSDLTMSIYNLFGQQVVKLVNAKQEAGRYIALWNGRDEVGNALPSGVYFLKMEASSIDDGRQFSDVAKLVLVR